MEYHDCHAGHTYHDRIVVDTMLGSMLVYDWEKYKDQKNIYCTGQDDISRTIKNTRIWEPGLYPLFAHIFRNGNNKRLFVDVGCNVGWYSRMARTFGYTVDAYDGNHESVDVCAQNIDVLNTNSIVSFLWFDEKTEPMKSKPNDIELLKIDIEGSEQHAIRAFEQYLKNGQINNIILEVSPVFNGSYPDLIQKIRSYGFDILEASGQAFNNTFSFDQKDLWCRKRT